MILYGEVAIKSRYLEAKPLKFSPPKSLCGTVGSPWVSLATLFGFWETLIKFSESMILYGEKSFLCSCAATEFKSETERHDRVAASVDTQKTTYQLMTDSHYTSSHLTDGLYQTSTLRQLVTGCH